MRSSSGAGKLKAVGSRDKHHIGQIKVDFDVVIGEGMVLLWIKNFQQS